MRLRPWFQYVNNPPPVTPGAMNMGFESEMLAWRPMLGPGIGVTRQLLMFAPQNYQAASLAALTGLQGVVHGQSVLQPLSNPYES